MTYVNMEHNPQTAEPTPPTGPMPVKNTAAHPAPDARPIAAAAALLRDAARKFEAHLSTIDPSGYTPEGLHRQVAAFNESPAAQQIDEAVQIATEREAAAEARVAEVIKSLSPEGDTADELRATRAWGRAQRLLDSASEERVGEVARRLIADADTANLGVLLAELPSYLQSKGQGADWLEQAAAAKVPELADAQRQLKLARQARPQVIFDADRLRGRIIGTRAPQAYEPVPFLDLGHYDPDR